MHFRAKDIIDNKYTVIFPVKREEYAEAYRVKDSSMNRYILTIIDTKQVPEYRRDSGGAIKEIELLKEVDNPNLPQLIEEGELESYVTNFVNSESVADRLKRLSVMPVDDTTQIVNALLQAIKHLHERQDPIIHNAVAAQNILIDLSSDKIDRVILTNFEHACHESEAMQQHFDDNTWFFMAPECLEGISTPQSDLYSVGALMYQMMFGILPWYCNMSNIAPENRKQFILKQKNSELLMPLVNNAHIDNKFLNVLRKALAADIDERFADADEFIAAINGDIIITPPAQSPDNSASSNDEKFSFSTKQGNGFDDVAGMDEIKQMLVHDVIERIRDIEKAKRYKLTIPNGILFYGPPGCGKTFIAEKFAEEAGYNFKLIKSSDLGSIYIHGSQGLIANLFDDARKNAPTILYFDEFDAFVPNRAEHSIHISSMSGEVNEFLSQLNNCGEQGVFVIASTNQPELIDPAVLRRGRIDKCIFIPVPDNEAKALIFEKHLEGRPHENDINFKKLAKNAHNYIASDIAYIVNEAASIAADSDSLITQEVLENLIKQNKPSLSQDSIDYYMRLREKMENISQPRRRVGF